MSDLVTSLVHAAGGRKREAEALRLQLGKGGEQPSASVKPRRRGGDAPCCKGESEGSALRRRWRRRDERARRWRKARLQALGRRAWPGPPGLCATPSSFGVPIYSKPDTTTDRAAAAAAAPGSDVRWRRGRPKTQGRAAAGKPAHPRASRGLTLPGWDPARGPAPGVLGINAAHTTGWACGCGTPPSQRRRGGQEGRRAAARAGGRPRPWRASGRGGAAPPPGGAWHGRVASRVGAIGYVRRPTASRSSTHALGGPRGVATGGGRSSSPRRSTPHSASTSLSARGATWPRKPRAADALYRPVAHEHGAACR